MHAAALTPPHTCRPIPKLSGSACCAQQLCTGHLPYWLDTTLEHLVMRHRSAALQALARMMQIQGTMQQHRPE